MSVLHLKRLWLGKGLGGSKGSKFSDVWQQHSEQINPIKSIKKMGVIACFCGALKNERMDVLTHVMLWRYVNV